MREHFNGIAEATGYPARIRKWRCPHQTTVNGESPFTVVSRHPDFPATLTELDTSIQSGLFEQVGDTTMADEGQEECGPAEEAAAAEAETNPNEEAASEDEEQKQDEIEDASSESDASLELEDMDLLDRIAAAKACVSLSPRGGLADANVWLWFHLCEPVSDRKLGKLLKYDKDAHDLFIKHNSKNITCCKVCYDNPNIALSFATKHIGADKSGSNCRRHVKSVHAILCVKMEPVPNAEKKVFAVDGIEPEDVFWETHRKNGTMPAPKRNAGKRTQAPVSSFFLSPPAKKAAAQSRVGAASPDVASAVTESSVNQSVSLPPLPAVNVQPPRPSAYEGHLQLGQEKVLREWHALTVDFATQSNTAARQFTSQKCPAFRNLMNYTINNAATLKTVHKANRFMGQAKFSEQRFRNLEELFGCIAFSINESRAAMHEVSGKRMPFVNFAHDMWTGKKDEKLGLTIFWHNVKREESYAAAIGLIHCETHKSQEVADMTLKMLARVEVEKADLCNGCNDNAGPAIKVTKILSGDRGECIMHIIDLMIEHGLGITTRSVNTVVVDEFPEGEEVRALVTDTVNTLTDKRAPKRMKLFKKSNQDASRKVIAIPKPNATRIGGVHIQYQGYLKGRWCFEELHHKHKGEAWVQSLHISNDDFISVAHVEAVISYSAGLSKVVQTNNVATISYCALRCYRLTVIYFTKDEWDVADVCEYNNQTNKWHGNAKFPKRPISPKFSVTQSKHKSLNEVNLIKIKTDDLVDVAQKLVKRMKAECTHYMKDVSRLQLVAMALNPLSATLGLKEMDELSYYLGIVTDSTDNCRNWKRDCRKATIQYVRKKMAHKLDEDSEEESEDDEPAANVDSAWAKIMRQNKPAPATESEKSCAVTREVDAFLELKINWQTELQIQQVSDKVVRSIGDNENAWLNSFEIIAKHFDPFKWWHRVGKLNFKLLFPVVVALLTLPESNGRQERTFSAATWFDTKLGINQLTATHEIKVMLYENRFLVEAVKTHMTGEYSKLAQKATREMIFLSNQIRASAAANNNSLLTGCDPDDAALEDDDLDDDGQMAKYLEAAEQDDASQLTEN